METKFKNNTLVHQVIESLWNPMEIEYTYDRYKNGMSIEDIIATDFIVMKKSGTTNFQSSISSKSNITQ